METIVLSVLSRGKAHGFELMQRINAQGNGAFHLKQGTIYPVLYRLERDGHVKARWADANEKSQGPRRRIYEITQKGSSELTKQRTEWRSFVTTVGRIVET